MFKNKRIKYLTICLFCLALAIFANNGSAFAQEVKVTVKESKEENKRVATKTPPQIVKLAPAVYPEEAVKKKLAGVVHVRVGVTAAGYVKMVSIAISSGSDMLDIVAMQTILSSKFSPALNEYGEKVSASGVFRLQLDIKEAEKK